MQQAAIVIAKISGNKQVQKEIQKLINLKMYNDDYIKFKDLFHPESNTNLKSTSTTLFAQAFRKVIKSGNYQHLKSSDVSDLEQFLIDNNLTLYVPYPLSEYPENMRNPTITFNPLDGDSVSTGYALSSFKSTNNIQPISNVGEGYSNTHPIYIIDPVSSLVNPVLPGDPGTGSGGGSGSGSGSGSGLGTGTGHWDIMLASMQIRKQYDAIWNGGSEIHFVFARGFEVDSVNHIVGIKYLLSSYTEDFSRYDIRKKNWKLLNLVLDPDWNLKQGTNYFGAVEIDVLFHVKLHLGVTFTVKEGTTSVSEKSPYLDLTFHSSNGFIGERELPRDYFFASQSNPAPEGHKTYNGKTIRTNGTYMYYTTNIIEY